MQAIRVLVYIHSEEGLEKHYQLLTDLTSPSSFVMIYPQLLDRLEIFWEKRSEWALSHRVEKTTRGNHTNNYAEAGIRVVKELIFGRVKAYNLLQMFEFVTTTMDSYYSNRLLDIAHSRFRPGISLRYRELNALQKDVNTIKQIRDTIYMVQEEVDKCIFDYVVDMELGMCSCGIGSTGAACRHQAAVAKHFKLASVNIPPIHSKECRHLFAVIARGKHTRSLEFYADLVDPSGNFSHNDSTDSTYHPPDDSADDSVDEPATTAYFDNSVDEPDVTTTNSTDLWSDTVGRYRDSLNEILEDLMERLQGGDHNLLSGVAKFIKSYKKMANSSAPDSTVSLLNSYYSVNICSPRNCLVKAGKAWFSH